MVELHMLTGWAEGRPFHLITEHKTYRVARADDVEFQKIEPFKVFEDSAITTS